MEKEKIVDLVWSSEGVLKWYGKLIKRLLIWKITSERGIETFWF